MDFYPQLTGVAKCELNTWEWQNSKVASATLSIPSESPLLMQGTQYPTSNLVMPQLHQMISGLQMPKITYVHTSQRETISRGGVYRISPSQVVYLKLKYWSTRKYVNNSQLCTESI